MTPSRTTLFVSLVSVAALAAAAAWPGLVQSHLSAALHALAGANGRWLAVAGVCFFGSFVCTVAAWRSALGAAGGRISSREAAARLGVGSLVNAFAPAKLGDAVKIALCARAIDAPDRLWTAGGAYAALAGARGLALAALVVVASVTGALPIWPVFILCGSIAGVGALAASSAHWRRHPGISRALAGIASLERSPRAVAAVLALTFGMAACRLVGALAVTLALGVPHPLLAALVILPALDLAGVIPVTPGSIGVGSGAVAVALASRGVGAGDALGVGIAMQGVETLVSVLVGGVGALYLVRPSGRVRRWTMRVAAAGVAIAAAATLGASLLDLT